MKAVANNSIRAFLAATIALVVVVSAILLVPGCDGAGDEGGGIKVATDIVPLADFCREVGGELVEVEAMVPPGSSPHSYELTTGQMKYLSEADILVINGLELTPWAEEIFTGVDNPNLVEVVAGDAVPDDELIEAAGAQQTEGETNAGHQHGIYDPHVWLDPNLAVYMVESIRDGLIQADPSHKAAYGDNADRYIGELMDLDAWIADEIGGFSSKKFVAFHSTWTYFARRYGLEQVAVIEELPGKEPAAGEIAAIVELIREGEVRVIFIEPQFNPQAAEAIAEEAGTAVMVKALDPLGDPGDPETDTYLETLRHDVQVMGEALR